MKRFPIGFWNYVDIARQDASAVDEWSDLGMTVAMSPFYRTADAGSVARMRSILDAAAAKDIRVILCDEDALQHAADRLGIQAP